MIKPGSTDNINYLISIGEDMADDFNIDDFNLDAWSEMVRKYSIYNDRTSLVFYNNLNTPAGLLLGKVAPIPHSGVIFAEIDYIYLMPEFLNHENLYELHTSFLDWANNYKIKSVKISNLYNMPGEYLDFFSDIGFVSDKIHSKGLE